MALLITICKQYIIVLCKLSADGIDINTWQLVSYKVFFVWENVIGWTDKIIKMQIFSDLSF